MSNIKVKGKLFILYIASACIITVIMDANWNLNNNIHYENLVNAILENINYLLKPTL